MDETTCQEFGYRWWKIWDERQKQPGVGSLESGVGSWKNIQEAVYGTGSLHLDAGYRGTVVWGRWTEIWMMGRLVVRYAGWGSGPGSGMG
jgi:hypothetical protein